MLDSGCQHDGQRSIQRQAKEDWDRLRAAFNLRLADEQLKQGHIPEAIETLQKAAAADPVNSVYHRMLARCHLEMTSLEAASQAIRNARDLGDKSAELAYLEGILAEGHLDHHEALHHYRRAAELEPTNVDYSLAVAECLVNSGRIKEAKTFLDERLHNAKDKEQLALLRAQVHVLLGDMEPAVSDFKAAEGLLLDAPGLAEEYGLALVGLGRYAEGVATLQPLIESARHMPGKEGPPPSGAAVRALATCHIQLGAPEKAVRLLEDHLTRSSDDGRAWWLLARGQLQLSDCVGARQSILHGEQLAPQLSDWKLLRAYIAWREGDLHQAADALESLLLEKPTDAMARRILRQINAKREGP
jgi:tetratricopeptide (TPR) repeat protein